MTPQEREAEALRRNAELRRKIAETEATVEALSTPRPPQDVDRLAQTQARADAVAQMFGERAPTPMPGEAPPAFRLRCVQKFQKFSSAFAKTDLAVADSAVLDAIEPAIYGDAERVARSGSAAPAGELVPVVETDPSGRRITRYTGDPMAWMAPYMGGGRVCFIERPITKGQ